MPGLRGTPEVMTTTSELARLRRSRRPPITRAVRSVDRARLEHVERDAGRLLIGDVDDDDVGQFLVGDAARHRRADVAGAADDCHFAIHVDAPR